MPYEGEFAGYRSVYRIAETERVKQLLGRARLFQPTATTTRIKPDSPPAPQSPLPDFIVAIDGSNAEVDVKNGYPGAKIGYCTVASVLLNLRLIDQLDEQRPVDPRQFRQTEQAATIDAALPGSNVITHTNTSACDSFREALFEVFNDVVVDEEDRTRIRDTYEYLLKRKPQDRGQTCPYDRDGCDLRLTILAGVSSCECSKKRPIYSTDALRIHERFHDIGTNGEALGEVMQVWERVLLVHLLRCFERRGLLKYMNKLAFFLDGPLAVFGHPAWLSAAISWELKRINALVQRETGNDLIILGIEKGGTFVTHFDEIDKMEVPGELYFPPRSYLLPTDRYIKERIIFSDSEKRYGRDTYFGRKFFYKTLSGARIVADLPFLSEQQDTLDSADVSHYSQFGAVCVLLDKLVSSHYPNALSPIVSAHAQAAIPLSLGAKVLEQLARALIQDE